MATSNPETRCISMPNLPYDVLILFATWLPPCAVSRLMRTCRTLYQLGLSCLLRDISLFSNEAISSFSLLLEAQSDPQHCCHYIRRLVFVVDSIVSEDAATLARILEGAKALQSLRITAPISLDKEERILAALGSLPALQQLSFGMPVQLTTLLFLVEKFRGKLQTMDCPHIRNEGAGKDELVDAISLCNPVLSSLHELSIRITIPAISPHTPVFIALQKLHLYGIRGGIRLDSLIHYFPNLRELSTEKFREAEDRVWSIEMGLYVSFCRRCRDVNKPTEVPWRHLQQLRAPLYFVHALGLTTRLAKLKLLVLIYAMDIETFAEVIEDTSPTNITFGYSVGSPTCLIALCEALVRTGKDIQCLSIILHHDEMEWASVTDILSFFVQQLEGLSLHELRVATRFRPNAEAARKYPELAVLRDDFEFFDVDGESLLSLAASAIPSLRTLCVQVEDPPTMRWEVDRPHDNVSLILDDVFDL